MTKEDLVNAVSQHSRLPKTKIATALDLFLTEVSEALIRHERVEIRRFGTFEVTYRRARVARDLNTNSEIRLPDRSMPRFVPFAAFKDLIAERHALQADEVKKSATIEPAPVETSMPSAEPVTPSPPDAARTTEARNRLRTLRQTVDTYPDNQDARLSLAVAYTEIGKYEEALEQCQAVLRLQPNHVGAINQQGVILELQGSNDRALQEYERARRIDRDNIDTLRHIGRLRSKQGNYTEAEYEFKRVLELNPNNIESNYNLGVIHTKRGLYGRAIQEFEQVLALDPECIDAYFHLGKTYDHLERYDDAIQMFEALLKAQPDNGRAYWHLGVLYDKLKDGIKALEMYQQANRLSTAKKGMNDDDRA